MPSVVASAFREAVVAGLSQDQAGMVDAARGGGPEHREVSRALMLGDRAGREWAATAISAERPKERNRLERLTQLGKPEDAYHELDPAARKERTAATSPELRAVVDAVIELADALPRIDTEATNEGNRAAFEAAGRAAADVLLRASAVLDGEDFVVTQANKTLRDLPALRGWENQLGPRFD